MTRSLTLLFAIACGATVANNYYAQPLLDVIAAHFDVGTTAAGLLVTASQVGFATGLVLLVPLGDVLQRRRLIVVLLLLCAASLVAAAAAPSLVWLAVAQALASFTAVVAQILVPFAATLALDEDRGRVIGVVMSGLLLGILSARTVAGLIAEVGGWRAVYATAAALMLVLALILWRRLPIRPIEAELRYPELLRSVWRLAVEEPLLRRRSFYGALTFGSFGAFWTTIAFLLSRDPYDYSEAVIGLFGLAGVAGAVAAQAAGRLYDRSGARLGTGAAFALGVPSFGLIALGKDSLAALLIGIVLMDVAVQAVQILNQTTIYAIRPEARSRLTGVYMTSYFIGGAIGSALGAAAYSAWGWTGSSMVGVVAFAVGFLAWLTEKAPQPAATT